MFGVVGTKFMGRYIAVKESLEVQCCSRFETPSTQGNQCYSLHLKTPVFVLEGLYISYGLQKNSEFLHPIHRVF